MECEGKSRLMMVAAVTGVVLAVAVVAIVWRARYVAARRAAAAAGSQASAEAASDAAGKGAAATDAPDVGLVSLTAGDMRELGGYVVESEVDAAVETKRLVDYTYREVGAFGKVTVKSVRQNADGSTTYGVEVDGKAASVTVPKEDGVPADGDWRPPEIPGDIGVYEEDYFARVVGERCAGLFPDAWNAYAATARLPMADSVYVVADSVENADGKVAFTVIDPRLVGDKARGQDTRVTFDAEAETFEFAPLGEYQEPAAATAADGGSGTEPAARDGRAAEAADAAEDEE